MELWDAEIDKSFHEHRGVFFHTLIVTFICYYIILNVKSLNLIISTVIKYASSIGSRDATRRKESNDKISDDRG